MRQKILIVWILLIGTISLFGQGASVSPSRLYFDTPVGKAQTREVTLTNKTPVRQTFQITFGDFSPNGNKGKVNMQKSGEGDHSMAEWLMANPAFVVMEGGETRNVQITLTVPNIPEANSVRWSTVQIKLVKEQTAPIDGSEKTLGFGIAETFQFVLYAFQTPPSVTFKKAEIINFRKELIDGKARPDLHLLVKNTGDAIIDCAAFIDLTNMNTGSTTRLNVKAFTMLPELEREISFELPDSLSSGKYSALGVIDFGSREEVEAAEINFDIP